MSGADNLNNLKAGLLLAAVGAGVYLLYRGAKAAPSVAQVGAALNPANPDNIVNRGASAVVSAATGGKSLSVGDWLYDKLNPGAGAWATDETGYRSYSVGVPSTSVPGVEQADVRAVDNGLAVAEMWRQAGYSYFGPGYTWAAPGVEQADVRRIDNEMAGERTAYSSFADPNGPVFTRYARP